MFVTSLVVEGPDQMSSTRLVRDDAAAFQLLRRLYPHLQRAVDDEELVHYLAESGVRTRIQQHDLSEVLAPRVPPSSPFGDLYRVGDAYTLAGDPRRGGYLRPATPMEAAISRSSGRLDGGLGVFGVRPRPRRHADADVQATQSPESEVTGSEFVHIGSDAWDHALVGPSVRYFRVENIPADATLPEIPAGILNPIA